MSIGPVLVVVGATSAACVGLGIAPFLGAFVVGLVYGRALANDLHLRSIEAFSLAFFIPLFFAIVGLKLDLFKDLDVTFTALFIAFAFVAKGSGVYLGARLARTEGSGSLNLAIALNARGGPGIVLATVGLNAGIINDMFFTTLIMTAVLTSLLAGWWLQIAVGRGLLSTADAPPRTVAELAV
jgi:Kef-type K+ transport system membrane component KefB